MKDNSAKLAVLIDADNALHKTIGLVLQEIAKYGKPVVKRVYGDWSSEINENGKLVNRLFVWRDVSLSYAITPVQQFAYTKGKDATDMMLIINAMDLLHDNHLDGFCIISSDSDFTPLASRIRESGLSVYGFGEKKTPKAFINACDKFIYIENLTENTLEESVNNKEEVKKLPQKTYSDKEPKIDSLDTKITANEIKPIINISQEVKIDDQTLQLIYKAIKEIAEDDGFANLSTLGNYLVTVKPDFDTRNYGRATLSKLLQASDLFEVEQRGSQKYVRNKRNFLEFLTIVREVIETSQKWKPKQWIFLNPLMIEIKKKYPEITANQFGYSTLLEMLATIQNQDFELNQDKTQIRLTSAKTTSKKQK